MQLQTEGQGKLVGGGSQGQEGGPLGPPLRPQPWPGPREGEHTGGLQGDSPSGLGTSREAGALTGHPGRLPPGKAIPGARVQPTVGSSRLQNGPGGAVPQRSPCHRDWLWNQAPSLSLSWPPFHPSARTLPGPQLLQPLPSRRPTTGPWRLLPLVSCTRPPDVPWLLPSPLTAFSVPFSRLRPERWVLLCLPAGPPPTGPSACSQCVPAPAGGPRLGTHQGTGGADCGLRTLLCPGWGGACGRQGAPSLGPRVTSQQPEGCRRGPHWCGMSPDCNRLPSGPQIRGPCMCACDLV